MKKRAVKKGDGEEILPDDFVQYSRLGRLRKSVSGSKSALSQIGPPQRLTDVVPWSDVVAMAEDFDFGVSLDDYEEGMLV